MKKLLSQTQQGVQRLLTDPLEELSRAQRTLRYMLDFGRYCAQELKADRAGEMAAALTYHTLFSLLPMMVVMLVILQTFVGEDKRETLKQDIIGFTLQWVVPDEKPLPESIEQSPAEIDEDLVEEAETEAVVGTVETTTVAIGNEDREASYKDLQGSLEGHAQNLLEWLEGINFASIGAIGVLIFFYAATKLLTTIERSFNRIYDAPYARPMLTRFTLYFTSIVLAPLVLLAGQLAQAWVVGFIEQAAVVTSQSFGQAGKMAEPTIGWAGEFTALISPFITTWLLLGLMYKLLPNTHVKARAAMTGGFVAALGWICVVEFFKIYVNQAGTASLYGALALPLLFLFWLWSTWLFVLFGLEVTYTLQMMKGRRFKSLRSAEDRDVIFDPRWMIPFAALIGKSFEEGKAIRMNELQVAMGLPGRAVSSLIEMLTRGNVIHHVEHGEPGVPAYTLARPPEKIGIDELLDLSGQAAMRDKNRAKLAGVDLIAQLHTAQLDAAKDKTLADVMAAD